jgi:hypothetical protein
LDQKNLDNLEDKKYLEIEDDKSSIFGCEGQDVEQDENDDKKKDELVKSSNSEILIQKYVLSSLDS